MKATEYFDRYAGRIKPELSDAAFINLVSDIYKDFYNELISIVHIRNIKTGKGFQSAVAMQNDKWNVLCRLFEKRFSASPIKLNGFQAAIEILMKKGGMTYQ